MPEIMHATNLGRPLMSTRSGPPMITQSSCPVCGGAVASKAGEDSFSDGPYG